MSCDIQDVDEIIEAYGLPELPEPADEDDGELRKLVLFLFQDENIVLAEGISLADAQEYCSREDTSGEGWFVGFNR